MKEKYSKQQIQEALYKAFIEIQKNQHEKSSLSEAIITKLPNQLLQDLYRR